MEGLLAALAAFAIVFVAELGDRTQFVLFALATRHPRMALFLGAAAAFFLHTLLAVVVGDRLGHWLPTQWVLILGGTVFLVMGAFTLKEIIGKSHEDAPSPRTTSKKGGFVTAFGFVLIAELGDKTQIATATLSATSGAPVATFLGGFLALLASAALALLLGHWVAGRLPERTVKAIAAGAFLFAGTAMLFFALW